MLNEKLVSPLVYVDSVVFELIGDDLSVLLIRRAREPFKGIWALPGSHNPAGETTHQAMARALQAKAGFSSKKLEFIEQLYTFYIF